MTREQKDSTIDRLIQKLGLQPLPGEGGYFSRVYTSAIESPMLLDRSSNAVTRRLGTSIYYLVTPEEFSALHRLTSDEIFHFYIGDPVQMVQISEDGDNRTIILGQDVLSGQQVQVVVPANTWQGTRLCEGGKYALLGTTVIPGFEYADFELGVRDDLLSRFPHAAAEIVRLTRERRP
jgi:predicted cupin superfamily sugar epimerase